MLRLHLTVLLLLAVAAQGQVQPPGEAAVPPFDPTADHYWAHRDEGRLTWTIAGCPDLRPDIEAGVARFSEQLDEEGLRPVLERKPGPGPDATQLRRFRDPDAGALVVQDIVTRAGVDVVIGCVEAATFDNITTGRGFVDLLGLHLAAARYDPSDGHHKLVAAIIIIPEGQAIALDGCGDPAPVGHDLRRFTVQHEMAHALGLGQGHAADGGVFIEQVEAENHSCTAWWDPGPDHLSPSTIQRIETLWGRAPAPSLGERFSSHVSEHKLWWIGVPTTLGIAALLWLGIWWTKRRRAMQSQIPEAGIRRLDGTLGTTRSTTQGVNKFRVDPMFLPAEDEGEEAYDPWR